MHSDLLTTSKNQPNAYMLAAVFFASIVKCDACVLKNVPLSYLLNVSIVIASCIVTRIITCN